MKGSGRVSTTAERLQEALDDCSMTQADLARVSKIDKGSISHYLSGKYEPKSGTINKLAIALNVSEMWLWGYDVPRDRSAAQKENDDRVRITVRMRRDKDFDDAVKNLYNLSADDFETISRLLSTFNK